MRTREEHINDLAISMIDEGGRKEASYRFAQETIEEAERRAEQRVREEIARDSERLDWLAGRVQEIIRISNMPTKWILEFHTRLASLDRDNLRQAIDAAREAQGDVIHENVGNMNS